MIYCRSTKVLLNLVAPLDSAVLSLDFEKISVFWTFSFDFVSIVFGSLSVSRSLPKSCCSLGLDVSSFDFKKTIFVYFVCIWCMFTTQFSLVILGQISAACSESWYRKLVSLHSRFIYYQRLWWSNWHAMLALFFLYVFLVWTFSWCDLFQVTGTDTSCVLYIICSQFITFEQVTLCSANCTCFVALSAWPYAVLLRICP